MDEEDKKRIKDEFENDLSHLKHLETANLNIQAQFLQVKGIFVGFIGIIFSIFFKLHHPPKILTSLELIMFFSFLFLAIDILINALDSKKSILSQAENATLSGIQLVAKDYPQHFKYGEKASEKRLEKMTKKVLNAMEDGKSLEEIERLFFKYNISFMWWFDASPWLWAILILAFPLLFIFNG